MKLKYKLKAFSDVLTGVNNGNIKLTDEQFEYLKKISLEKGIIVGMHNTDEDLNSFFNTGLYNNRDYLFKETCDLTNTVAYSSVFLARLGYHSPRFTTILIMIPEEVIEGKKGFFERLNDGGWGIPPEYIIGAFKSGEIISNPNYKKDYFNPNAKLVEDSEDIPLSYEERKQEIEICSKAFYIGKKLGSNEDFIKRNGKQR